MILRVRIEFDDKDIELFDEYGVDVRAQALARAQRIFATEIVDYIHISELVEGERTVWYAQLEVSENV